MAVTPRPWHRSPKASDAIIASESSRQPIGNEIGFYGGCVVAESIHSEDLDFILRAVAFYDKAHSPEGVPMA